MGRSSTTSRAISQSVSRGSCRAGIAQEEVLEGTKARADGGIVCAPERFRW